MINFITDFWGLIMGLVTSAAWLFRLEGRAKANTAEIKHRSDALAAEIKHLKAQRHEDHREAVGSRRELSDQMAVVSQDIKVLIREVAKR